MATTKTTTKTTATAEGLAAAREARDREARSRLLKLVENGATVDDLIASEIDPGTVETVLARVRARDDTLARATELAALVDEWQAVEQAVVEADAKVAEAEKALDLARRTRWSLNGPRAATTSAAEAARDAGKIFPELDAALERWADTGSWK